MSFYVQPNGGNRPLPHHFIEAISGDPLVTLTQSVFWDTGEEQAELPYTSKRIYPFEVLGSPDWGRFQVNSSDVGRVHADDITSVSGGSSATLSMNIQNIQGGVSFKSLTSAQVGFVIGGIGGKYINMGSLETAWGFAIVNNTNLTEIKLPSLTTLTRAGNGGGQDTDINNNPNVKKILMPNLTTCNHTIDIRLDMTSLEEVNIDSLIEVNALSFYKDAAFPQSMVDYILMIYATNNGGNPITSSLKVLHIDRGTSAAPSVVGEGYIDILRANGWTVLVNGGY